MALTTADFASTILTYKLASDTDADATAVVDVTGGSGKLYYIHIDNQAGNSSYAKFALTTSTITVGTTAPDLMIEVAASSVKDVVMPDGVDFNSLSFWCVAGSADSDTTAPAQNVTVRVVAS
jgi:hypothetical protein